jgi:hypothetical protein
VIAGVFGIVGCPERDAVRAQLTLPLRFGGCGIRVITPHMADAAFLASAAVAETTMRTGPPCFRPFAAPGFAALYADIWASLRADVGDESLWDAASAQLTPKVIDEVLPSAQREFSRFSDERRYAALLASFDGGRIGEARDKSRLLSTACRAATIYLDTLPSCPAFRLGDADFRAALRHQLGVPHLPANAVDVECECRQPLRADDPHHAMTCSKLCGVMTLRHNLFVESVRRIAHRAGVASSVEPPLRHLPGARAARAAATPQARGDILLALNEGLTVVDVSFIHPAATTYVRDAQTAGGAAARRDREKEARYRSADPTGYKFVPVSVETYGRLGKPALQLLTSLASAAAANGVVERDRFVENAMRQLSITLRRGNGAMFSRCLGQTAKAAGACFRAGADVPFVEGM